MSGQFSTALNEYGPAFGIALTEAQIDRLAGFYELVDQHNPGLHLVGPSSPGEFATRHVLESLTLLKHLPQGADLADVGTGAGLPSIPCLLARGDLRALLIESKEKKAVYLQEAAETLGIGDRVNVVNRQYAETDPGDRGFVTCRALDKFTDRLPHLIRWAKHRTMLLFGGEGIRDELYKQKMAFEQELMPLSERRYLFVVR